MQTLTLGRSNIGRRGGGCRGGGRGFVRADPANNVRCGEKGGAKCLGQVGGGFAVLPLGVLGASRSRSWEHYTCRACGSDGGHCR